MARTNKAGAAGQLPRPENDTTTVEGIHHDHHDSDGNLVESHLHRLGNLHHLHLEDGKVEFADGQTEQVAVTDQHYGMVADDQYIPAPQPIPAGPVGGYFNGNNLDRDAELEALQAEANDIAQRRPDAIATNGQARPVAVSGAPGSRLSDVASRAIALTMEGYPSEVHDEVIWTEIATHALVSMREEQARTHRVADPALVSAALDAVLHLGKARGLA